MSTWYDDMLAWLAEEREHELRRAEAYEDGFRAGRLSATLQWPELRRPDYARRAYLLGIERGRLEAAGQRPAAVIVIHRPPPAGDAAQIRPRIRLLNAADLGEASA